MSKREYRRSDRDVQLPMYITERSRRLLHRRHRLGIEARALERVYLHLELESGAL